MAALWQRLLVINYDIFQLMANILLETKVYFSSCLYLQDGSLIAYQFPLTILWTSGLGIRSILYT